MFVFNLNRLRWYKSTKNALDFTVESFDMCMTLSISNVKYCVVSNRTHFLHATTFLLFIRLTWTNIETNLYSVTATQTQKTSRNCPKWANRIFACIR